MSNLEFIYKLVKGFVGEFFEVLVKCRYCYIGQVCSFIEVYFIFKVVLYIMVDGFYMVLILCVDFQCKIIGVQYFVVFGFCYFLQNVQQSKQVVKIILFQYSFQLFIYLVFYWAVEGKFLLGLLEELFNGLYFWFFQEFGFQKVFFYLYYDFSVCFKDFFCKFKMGEVGAQKNQVVGFKVRNMVFDMVFVFVF